MDYTIILYLLLFLVQCDGKEKETNASLKDKVKEAENRAKEKARDQVARTLIIKYTGSDDGIKNLAENNGYKFEKKIAGHFYKVFDKASPSAKSVAEVAEVKANWERLDNKVKSVEPDKITNVVRKSQPGRQKRFDVNDPYWNHQWHLHCPFLEENIPMAMYEMNDVRDPI